MNVKNKAFLLVSLVILLLSGFILYEGMSHFNSQIDSEILKQEEIIDNLTQEILSDVYDPYLYKIKYFIDENEQVLQAFANKDRALLLKTCQPIFRYFHGENKYFHAMDFNLPDGTVFVRIQKPELYGDNIGSSRSIVSEVHETGRQLSGFDIGKHGAIFWVAHPITYKGAYLGAVEFGIEVKQLEISLAQTLGHEVAAALHGNKWQKAELVKHGFKEHRDHVLMTRGDTIFDQISGVLDFSKDDQWVTIGDKQYVLHSCANLLNYNKESIGNLLVLQDLSPYLEKKRDFIVHAAFLTLALLVLSFLVLYYSVGGLIGRLEEYAQESKHAKDELQRAHDTLDDKVKERTVELAKSNARLEDEVTIRRRTEIKLEDQRKFLATLIESLSHPLYVIDSNTYQVVMANKAACSLTDIDSYYGMTCYGMTRHGSEPCSGEEHPCPLEEVKKSRKPIVVEHVHLDREKKERYYEIHAYPMFDQDGNVSHIIEYNLDVTERKASEKEKGKLRAQLFASQKMEAVGVLAGGVAHDFNNILTTILGYSQIMALKFDEENPMREMVEEIYDAAEKASGLTRQLLAFSRKQVMEMKVVGLNSIVENISKMLGRLIGEDIEMRLSLLDSTGNVKVDVGQIEQVIMNLAINARDAMPDGGQLTIETGRIELDEDYAARHSDVKHGLYTMLTVTDTGRGMTQEIQDKIFEPFFTTKKSGKGTGLGLSTVYGIVRQHNGHIYVYSEPEKGTTFKIYLPLVEGVTDEVTRKESRAMPLGNETLLVVDDDAAIRRLIKDTMEPLGYNVIEAGSGEDALAVKSRTEEKIDLVLTDLIMPGMNGQELINTLEEDQPGIKSILMSGYTSDIMEDKGAIRSGVNFVSKPLLPISLANKVREVLDSE